MPIKEIITIASVVVGGWYVTGGHDGMWKNIRRFQIQVLRDVGNTSNWGNPSIFQYKAENKNHR